MGVVIQLHADGPISADEYHLMRQIQGLRAQREQMRHARVQAEIRTAAIVDAAVDHMLFAWSIHCDIPPTEAEYAAKRNDLRALLMRAALNATKEH